MLVVGFRLCCGCDCEFRRDVTRITEHFLDGLRRKLRVEKA
jgi:hypothetical protein